MLKAIKITSNNITKPLIIDLVKHRDMTYLHSARFKGKDVVKEYANDGTGKHPHIIKQNCAEESCENKQCKTPCAEPLKHTVCGHVTHAPKIGRYTKHIADIDAHGEPKRQYYIPSKPKKAISPELYKQLEESNAIKKDVVYTEYMHTSMEVTGKHDE